VKESEKKINKKFVAAKNKMDSSEPPETVLKALPVRRGLTIQKVEPTHCKEIGWL
jgi:hypothetical protein